MKLKQIFGKERNVIIGAVHLPPLLGYPGFPGFPTAIKNALRDVRALEKGGADGIIFENNYDLPHTVTVSPATISAMTLIGENIKRATRLPLGVCVLWNDYRAALSIAKTLDLQFVRIPVFVDTVKTSYGIVHGEPKKVIAFRKSIDAERVALFTDIHVKHAKLLSRHDVASSARLARRNGSDAIVITGEWTGDAPRVEDLTRTRKAISDFPIIIGSGVNAANIKQLFGHVNGAIVSTSLKTGREKRSETNIKPYRARIDARRVRALIRSL